MKYRKLGNTGMSAGVIGLGTEHLDNKPYEVVEEVVDAALEHGMNFFDLFMPGTPVRENIGRALKGRRKDVIIQGHIGSTDLKQQYDVSRDTTVCEKYFEELLRCLDTDYIDIGMLFFIDTDKDFDDIFKTPFIDYALKLKEQGKIRVVGASSHNPVTALKAIETGLVQHLMFSVNLAFDMLPANVYVFDSLGLEADKKMDGTHLAGIDPIRAKLYETCASRNISISVMKTLGAGKLLSPDHTPFAKPMTVGQCIHYALSRPGVASTLIGCKNRQQVVEAVKYLDMTDKEKDYTDIAETYRSDFKGKCVYCNHCLPCPSEIDIASVTKYLEIAALDESNVPPSIRQHYAHLGHHASECIQCGSCETRCPFNVAVIENMDRAAKLFGK